MTAPSSASLDAVFHALADPTRRVMLRSLALDERSIGELAAPFAMSFAAASKHVRVLEAAGLLVRRREGRSHICRIDPAALKAAHQWLAADWMAPTWSAGVFFGRWRFNTDAMYASTDFPLGTGWCEFDTTLYPGARGSYRDARWGFVQLEAIFGTRYNAFHQNNSGCPAPDAGRNLKDVRNRTLRLTIAPRIFR